MLETLTAPAMGAVVDALPTDLITTREAAQRLRTSKGALYEWMSTGALRHYRLGRSIRLREADVAEYLDRCRSKPPTRQSQYDRH